MKWQKLGKVFVPDGSIDWMHSHAAVPFIEKLEGDLIKVYFTSRNAENKSLIAWLILNMKNPFHIVELSQKPVLELGDLGCFDEDGTMGSQLITIEDASYLYYQGWNLATSVLFRNSIGVAIRKKGDTTFNKFSKGPLIDRGIYDPCFVATPNVFKEKNQYLMYYLSCDEWVRNENKITHRYNIKIAESVDGINWARNGKIAIDYKSKEEYAISVPRVRKENGIFKMWYSCRGNILGETYRIGYAESENGYDWTRMDEKSGIDISDTGWDSEMICYPYIFDYNERLYMLYNGNGYGKTGFGIAVHENY